MPRKSIYDYMHNLKGKKFSNVDEILSHIGANFNALKSEKLIATFRLPNGGTVDVPVEQHAAIGRVDDPSVLGVLGRDYGLTQYRDALAPVEEMLAEGVELIAGDCPNKGEVVYIVLRAPGTLELGVGDIVENYFLMTSSHNGSKRIEIQATPYRKVNGSVMIPQGKPFSFKHGSRVNDRIAAARATVSRINRQWDDMSDRLKRLTDITLSADQAIIYFEGVIGDSDSTRAQNMRDKLFDLWWETGTGAKLPSCKQTLFGAYQAVCEWVDHYRTTKKSKWKDEHAARLFARLQGDGARKKMEALSVAFKLEATLGEDE